MKVNQISGILNDIFGEVLGETGLVAEDLSNIVSAGRTITGASTFDDNFDNYAKAIVDKVGRTIFVDRVYKSKDLGIWRDAFEYGSVLEKIRTEVGEYKDNQEWDLTDESGNGTPDYNDNLSSNIEELFKFFPASLQAKYFNLKTTFKVVISITRKQLRGAFNSASEMARFVGMIENRIMTKMEIGKDQLQRRTIVNLIGEHIATSSQVYDLKQMYADETGKTAPSTLAEALNDPEAIRFIAKHITQDRDFMTVPSTIYSATGTFYNHTPEDLSRLIVLSDVDTALKFNLYGDTYNEEFVKLSNYKTLPFWQSTGQSMDILDRSAINVRTTGGNGVNRGSIIGILFDRDAAMIANEEPDVRTQYNPGGNFTNFFYCMDCSFYNDFDENAIIYLWGDVKILPTNTPTKAKGTNSGTTAVTITAKDAVNNSLYIHIGDPLYIAPGTIIDQTDTSTWTAITSGTKLDNIPATAGQTATIVEVDTSSSVVLYDTAYTVTASIIK